jgi:hypothetical protein
MATPIEGVAANPVSGLDRQTDVHARQDNKRVLARLANRFGPTPEELRREIQRKSDPNNHPTQKSRRPWWLEDERD